MKVGIVLLYGLLDNDRPDSERYYDYLKSVAQDITNDDIEKIVLCGGFTNPKKPDISEAGSVKEYLQNILTNQECILEDQSLTTNQNIQFASKHVNADRDEITVYCDLARKAKVMWIALHYLLQMSPEEMYKAALDYAKERNFNADFEYKNLRVKGYPYSQREEELLGQTHFSIIDVLALFNPDMEEMELEQRRKDFGLPN